jgi:hypothetical protein
MAVASVTTDQIIKAYQDTLGRVPGPEEVNFWVDYSRTNDATQTANAFLAGANQEIASRPSINIPAATSNVTTINLPVRTSVPEPTTMPSIPVSDMGPVLTPSVTEQQIIDSYTTHLNRTPNAEEIGFWLNYSKSNDPTQTANAFLAGAENEKAARRAEEEQRQQAQAQAQPTSSVTEQQILDSYSKFLNRTPGQEEIDFWVDYGRTNDPTQTAEAFINSARKEIGDITRSGYVSYLGRDPTQEEVDFWTQYTIDQGAAQAANAWRAGADEELARRETVSKTISDAEKKLEGTGIGGRLVSESTAGLPYGGGIYKRTPEEEAAYQKELSSIPVRTSVPLPVMPMSTGPSDAMARIQSTGEMTPGQYYSNIRETVSGGQYTPAELRKMQQQIGTSSQDINVAMGRGMSPITTAAPTMPGGETPTGQQSMSDFIRSKIPPATPTVTPPMFMPETVKNQLELERLRLQPTPATPAETPVAGFAQGGMVGNDINRMLQNQRNAIQRESQSRQMLNTMGAPPVKKFSDGGPAGSPSSGVRRLKMSGYADGGEVTDEMFTGTLPTDQGTSPGILPPEIRQAIDVPLDFANMAIRGTVGAVAGPAYGLYKGLTSDKLGTKEGVSEARSEAERMMGQITGEPKTQQARDIMDFVGEKVEQAKIPMMPQFLTMPLAAPGSARAAMRSYELRLRWIRWACPRGFRKRWTSCRPGALGSSCLRN